MSLIPPGSAEVTISWEVAPGYRRSQMSWGFNVVAWDEVMESLVTPIAPWIEAMEMPSTFTVRELEVKVGTADPSEPLVYTSTLALAGSGTIPLASPNVSMLMRKRTARGGRAGRGRAYLPPPAEQLVDNVGQLDTEYRETVETATVSMIGSWSDDLGGAEPYGVLLHSVPPDTVNEITGVSLEGTVATQRRRLLR